MKHANIAIFVPHAGCPHQCSFCDQKSISGAAGQPTAQLVTNICHTAAQNLGDKTHITQIAFFGGSFTAIDKMQMKSLLEAAYMCVKQYGFAGIRCSTRPDAVDDEIIDILQKYGVTAVELGVQSMQESVLQQNTRGHDTNAVVTASRLISDAGMELGHQMMTGLYGDNDKGAIDTAEKICMIRPATVRIYPTVVLKHTRLAQLWAAGQYAPQTLEESVALCAKLLRLFREEGIKVIRLGLHAEEELQKNLLAGPYHPAFCELCESRLWFEKVSAGFAQQGLGAGAYALFVPAGMLSQVIGQKKANLSAWSQMGYDITVREKPKHFLPDGTFAISRL